MPQKPRKRLPSAVLEKARQLAEAQAPEVPGGVPQAPSNTLAAPASASGGRNAVKAKITQALRKLHPMD